MVAPRRRLALTAVGAALAASGASAASEASNSTAASSTPKVDGWYDCSASSFASQLPEDATDAALVMSAAQCAIFKAPLCYDDVCEDASSTEIDIFVKRIKASAFSSSAPNIFFMQGGPGAASPAMESAMTGIYSLMNGEVNVYTMDHRGTGRSTQLDCVAAQAQTSGSPGGTSVDSAEVGTCADEIESKYGSDLSSFSATSAASDLSLFISSFLTGQDTYVYGVSYGSSLVERLIHLNTTGISGYILDGISTTSGSSVKNFEYFSTWDVDFDEVGQYFLSFCATNQADCGKYFTSSSVSDTLRTLTNGMDSGSAKCTSAADTMFANLFGYSPGDYSPGSILRQVMGSLLGDASTRNLIPILTYRLTRCNSDDIKVVNHFLNIFGESLTGTSESEQYTSDLLYKLIVYSEFWESPTPSYDTLVARYLNTTISSGTASAVETYCVFSKESSSACKPYGDYTAYSASPLIYKRDKYWNVAAKPPSDVSVLLMSSKMDPQTPHKYAEYLYEALDTKNKALVTFEQATHGTLWTTPMSEFSSTTCGMTIVTSYLSKGGDLTRMDKSCVAQMPAVSFAVSPSLVEQWLNASSAFDGEYTGTSSEAAQVDGSKTSSDSTASSGSSYKAAFIVFTVLFVVAAAAAVVFIAKWRRAKKESAKDVQVYEETNA